MYKYDYLKIGVATPKVKLGKCMENAEEILRISSEMCDASIILFPELSVSGCTLGDWHNNREKLNEEKQALNYIIENSSSQILIVGAALEYRDNLYNCAFIIQNKKVLGIVPKVALSKSHDLNDSRIFTSGKKFIDKNQKINFLGHKVPFGVNLFKNIENDIVFGVELASNLSPNSNLYQKGAHVIFNLSASSYYLGRSDIRKTIAKANSYDLSCAYVYVSNGASETASDVIFTGHQLVSELGELLLDKEELSFESSYNLVDIDLQKIKHSRLASGIQTSNSDEEIDDYIEFEIKESCEFYLSTKPDIEPFVIKDDKVASEIVDVISTALYHRLNHIKSSKVVIGVSGGLDSTLALLVAGECFKKYNIPLSNIIAFSMPGLATGSKSQQIALDLMNGLGVKGSVLSIEEEVKSHFKLIDHDETNKNTTYENVQARYRTLVLMNVANAQGGIVLGTGDMSEIALGWSTFNGDQMSMYNINAGLPKTAIRSLVGYFARKYPELAFTLTDVINATISPELTSSSQSTEDIIGRYEINDFIMLHVLSNGANVNRITFLLKELFSLTEESALVYYNNFMRRFKQNQFKRLAAPEGIKIFNLSLSPHGDFKFPGDMK